MKATRNHAAWVGPLLVLIGVFSYFTLAVQVPSLRDSALLNLILVFGGLLVAGLALFRRRNWKSWLGLGVAGFLTALFSFYIFVFSSQLPSADNAARVGVSAPPLELPDQTGRTISLAEFQRMNLLDDRRGGRVLVVFYRGFW
jgi:hypothetical protein